MAIDPIYLNPVRLAILTKNQQKTYASRAAATADELKRNAEINMNWADSLSREWRAVLHEIGPVRTKRAVQERADPSIVLLMIDFVL